MLGYQHHYHIAVFFVLVALWKANHNTKICFYNAFGYKESGRNERRKDRKKIIRYNFWVSLSRDETYTMAQNVTYVPKATIKMTYINSLFVIRRI